MNFDKLTVHAPKLLSILRIVTALMFIEHGTQKLLGFPAAGHPMGALPLQFMVAGVLEIVGGLMVLLGWFTRPVAFILSGEMAVAYWTFHVPHGGLLPIQNFGESAALFCFVFLYLVFAGPGEWSLDTMQGREIAGAVRA